MSEENVGAVANPLAMDLDIILARTRPLWEELRGNRLFLTGGTGFFGCWLLESFLWACDNLNLQAEVILLTRNPEAFQSRVPHLARHKALRIHTGDVRSFEFPNGSFSHVIHAATEVNVTVNEDDPLLMLDTIIEGTRRALDFTRHCGAKKFLLTSSGAVYGSQPPEMTHVPEHYQGAPDTMDLRSAYGEGKRIAELLCAIYARRYGIETKIARCFAFVGPYMPLDAHYAIGNFIRDALAGGPIEVKGDGTSYRSYLYSADLAVWLWTILFQGPSGRAYNVGSDQTTSILELAAAVVEASGSLVEVHVQGESPPAFQPQRYVPSIERAKVELGLIPRLDLRSSLLRTLASQKAQMASVSD